MCFFVYVIIFIDKINRKFLVGKVFRKVGNLLSNKKFYLGKDIFKFFMVVKQIIEQLVELYIVWLDNLNEVIKIKVKV